uniref:SPIN-DOC-like zinc-finger domain-containing protein n=1 Tax=Knipowitschia caucasica TaxID=637954 RepID=A0AAV2IVT7_KNICA
MSSAKRRKTYAFHEEWETDFLFTNVNDKCVCLICGFSVAVGKRCNVQRHFVSVHGNFSHEFPTGSNLRKEKCDESVDASDTAQLALFVRMVFEDFSTKEEFLTLLPLKTSTRGIDIYNVVKGYVVDKKFPIRKLVSITSDGAPAMTGRHNGFIAHCKADPDFPKFLNYHYNQLHSTKGKATSELQIVPGGMRRGSRGSSPSYGHQVVKSRSKTQQLWFWF